MNNKTDEQLIKDFQNDDVSAYNHLVYRYKDKLFNYSILFINLFMMSI